MSIFLCVTFISIIVICSGLIIDKKLTGIQINILKEDHIKFEKEIDKMKQKINDLNQTISDLESSMSEFLGENFKQGNGVNGFSKYTG